MEENKLKNFCSSIISYVRTIGNFRILKIKVLRFKNCIIVCMRFIRQNLKFKTFNILGYKIVLLQIKN